MVVVLGGSAATLGASGLTSTCVTAGATVGLASGISMSIKPAAEITLRALVTGACATAGSAGAIIGAVLGGPAGISGSLITGTTGAVMAAGTTAMAGSLLAGPIGWITLGLEEDTYTFDCWKPILHVESKEPSNGILLRDLANDTRIKSIQIKDGSELCVCNVWEEEFHIRFISLADGRIAAHAE